MDDETARALADVNRRFYRERAEEFAATRREPWPGWQRLVELLEAHAVPLDVLDVGCGNGRFAAFLAAGPAARRGLRYLGIDASPELLCAARARGLASARFERVDFVETPPEQALPPGPFSLVVLFGVLHHVSGRERRRALLAAAARRLRPGGVLAVNVWRPEAFARFAGRFVPFEGADLPAPIDLAQLEQGDRLLPWGDGRAVRYFHTGGESELRALAAELPLEPLAEWCSDGREGALNLYLALRAPGRA
jgi:SAM-dependent methyltransferase